MIIGIAGTIGAGKGEKSVGRFSQDLASYLLSDNEKVATRCTATVSRPCPNNSFSRVS
jgi:dephospho-CoA kinase